LFGGIIKTWKEALRDGAVSGSIASLVTTAVLVKCGERENATPYAAINAISHWLWGDRAAVHDEPSARHTLVGYAIHHASATLWAVLYEKWFGRKAENNAVIPAFAGGAVVAAVACFVDYKVVPRRFSPGYEMRLTRRSLFLVYAACGAAFAVRGTISRNAAAMSEN
jgi:RsiW-degrading membrane proteinase PrsW (M82 family)